jgi:hypothetical protein
MGKQELDNLVQMGSSRPKQPHERSSTACSRRHAEVWLTHKMKA